MNKGDILKVLKKESGVRSAKFPRELDFNMLDGQLDILMKRSSVVENMQNDASCFEGWSIVMKRWISSIKKVNLKWEEPLIHFLTPSEAQHYQRFLFRVQNFNNAYDWFGFDAKNEGAFNQSVFNHGFDLLVNAADEDRPREYVTVQALSKYSERKLEEFILSHTATTSSFKETLELDTLDNQLPVGLFCGEVSDNSKVFTGGTSAIDIWGIKVVADNKREISLFELKKSNNKKVGALTEMLFYANHIDHVIKKKFRYNMNTPATKLIQSTQKVNCYLLAPAPHPLIDNEIFSVMNSAEYDIHYGSVEIYKEDNEMKFLIRVQ